MGSRGTAWALSRVPCPADAHMWMETRPDFLLLRPIRAAVSPAPDERLTQMRKHLQRFERRPDEPDSQRARPWPAPRGGPVFTEVTIVHGRGPAAKPRCCCKDSLNIFSLSRVTSKEI